MCLMHTLVLSEHHLSLIRAATRGHSLAALRARGYFLHILAPPPPPKFPSNKVIVLAGGLVGLPSDHICTCSAKWASGQRRLNTF